MLFISALSYEFKVNIQFQSLNSLVLKLPVPPFERRKGFLPSRPVNQLHSNLALTVLGTLAPKTSQIEH